MRNHTPTATINPLNRSLAGAVLAFIILQLAFVPVGDAEVLAIGLDTSGPTVASAVVPSPSSDGTALPASRERATLPDADAQLPPPWPPIGIRMYVHPFLLGHCFWFCIERTCPCLYIP